MINEDKLVARLVGILNGRHSDDKIYCVLRDCDTDPNMVAHKFLDQDAFHEVKGKRQRKREKEEMKKSQALMKKMRPLDQVRSSSQTPESTQRNLTGTQPPEDEPVAVLPSTLISEATDRILDAQPSKDRSAIIVPPFPVDVEQAVTKLNEYICYFGQLTPSETREANDWVDGVFIELREEDCEIASGEDSVSAAQSTKPVFSSHEPDRIFDPQTLPHRDLPAIGSHLMGVSGSTNFTSTTNETRSEPSTYLQNQRPPWLSSAPQSEDNFNTQSPTGDISFTDGLIGLQQNIAQQFRSSVNNQSSASASARAILGNPAVPQYIRGNNLNLEGHYPQHAEPGTSLQHQSHQWLSSVHQSNVAGNNRTLVPITEPFRYGRGSNLQGQTRQRLSPASQSNVAGNSSNAVPTGRIQFTNSLTGLEHNIPQQFRAFPNNQPSSDAGAIYGDQLSRNKTGSNLNIQLHMPQNTEPRSRSWLSLVLQSNVVGNSSGAVPTGRIPFANSLTGLQQNIPQQFRAFPNNPSSASAGTSAVPRDQLVCQYIRENELILGRLRQQSPDCNLMWMLLIERRRLMIERMMLQMSQRQVEQDLAAERPSLMNQQHVRRDPTDSSQSGSQRLPNMPFSGSYLRD